jgi:hypothetical protein
MGVLKVLRVKDVAVGTPGRRVAVSRGVFVALGVILAGGVLVTAGVGEANNPVWVCAASTVCQIWVYARDGSAVGVPFPQADRLNRANAIRNQMILAKRYMHSSRK